MKLSKQNSTPPSSASLQSLAQGSMFWRPDHVELSAWLDHLPWIFWLMEAMLPQRCVTLGARSGSPHLALCQGVSRLGLNTECLLVAESDGNEVDKVHAIADRRYGALAGRINISPRRGAKQLEVGSIDILALDLSADDEDMEDVLERWLPRISERGIILIPGINRREPGCIAHQSFISLQSIYHSITFHHGDGLGVLVVGERPPELLETLLARWNAPTAARTVREVFARLGRACVDQALADTQTARLHSVKEKLESVQQERLDRVALLAQLQTQIKERDEDLAALEADKLHLAEENADTQRMVQTLQTELAQVRSQLSEKDAAYQEVEQQKRVLETTVAERDSLIAEKEANIQTRFRELATMTNIAEEADRQKEIFKNKAAVYNERNEAKKLDLKALRRHIGKLENEKTVWRAEKKELLTLAESADAIRSENQQALTKISELEALVVQLKEMLASSASAKNASDRNVAELKKLLKKREKSLSSRFDELGALTAAMEEKEKELAALKGEMIGESPQRLETARPHVSSGLLRFPAFISKSEERKEQLRLRRKQLKTVAEVESSEWFDSQWYLKQYPDIASDDRYSTNPALHYLKFGGFEGRDPSPYFDSAGYLEAYPDVAITEINPLLHFIRDGIKEGRSPRP